MKVMLAVLVLAALSGCATPSADYYVSKYGDMKETKKAEAESLYYSPKFTVHGKPVIPNAPGLTQKQIDDNGKGWSEVEKAAGGDTVFPTSK